MGMRAEGAEKDEPPRVYVLRFKPIIAAFHANDPGAEKLEKPLAHASVVRRKTLGKLLGP